MDHLSAVEWLLGSTEPAIRALTRRELLDEDGGEPDEAILAGPKVSALLAGQQVDGGFAGYTEVRRYRGTGRGPEDLLSVEVVPFGGHWASARWRLISLVELGIPTGDPRVRAAAEHVVAETLDQPWHRGRPTVIDGLTRVCASGEGTALVIMCRLGMADDKRARQLVDALLAWQWPDGGWNCHRNASGRRSSFHESLTPAWGLHEYARTTGDTAAAEAANRAAELFLEHRLVYSLGTGQASRFRPNPPPAGTVINQRWVKLGYPSYWHYDILAALLFLARVGKAGDPRAEDGLDLLERRRRPDGLWSADRQWWVLPGSRFKHQYEVVDWGRAGEPSEMITLNASRILRTTGRLVTPRQPVPRTRGSL